MYKLGLFSRLELHTAKARREKVRKKRMINTPTEERSFPHGGIAKLVFEYAQAEQA